MESMLEKDAVLAADMVELGIRWSDWTDAAAMDESMNEYFGKEKAIDFNVFSAEIQLTTNAFKMTTDEEDSAVSSDDYDIDPETGEKIFRQATIASPPSSDKWIEEYLSEIESASNQILPATTAGTTTDINFDDIPFSFFENTSDQPESDWLSTLIDLDETTDSNMFSEPVVLVNSEEKSNQSMTTSLSSMYIPLSNENNSQSTLLNTLHPSTDDEYSTSSSSNSSRQHQLYSLDQTTFVETKLEKIEPDDNSMSLMLGRRSSTRSVYQGQQDEESLQRLNIPLTVDEITQSNTEDYNRILVRMNHLNPEQIHLIKDIRRRGKNKIAAQNCRKRKAVSVESLLEEVDELKRVKHDLEERKRLYQQQIEETRHQYEYLHRQVLPDRQLPPAISVQ